jgi:hypothetical protein
VTQPLGDMAGMLPPVLPAQMGTGAATGPDRKRMVVVQLTVPGCRTTALV